MVSIYDLTFIWPWNDLKWPLNTGTYSIWPRIWLLHRIWRRNFDDLYMTSNDLEIYFFEFYAKNGIDWCVYRIGFSLYSSFFVFFTSWSIYSVSLELLDPKSWDPQKSILQGQITLDNYHLPEKKLGLYRFLSGGPLDKN